MSQLTDTILNYTVHFVRAQSKLVEDSAACYKECSAIEHCFSVLAMETALNIAC
jgi:hypothetical protein